MANKAYAVNNTDQQMSSQLTFGQAWKLMRLDR